MKNRNNEFTLKLAAADALPVLLFSASMIIIAYDFRNPIFAAGAVLCALSGTAKVIWKFIIAFTGKSYSILSRQMRFLMPAGFLLMILGLLTGMSTASWKNLGKGIISFPSCIFFLITLSGMTAMCVFAGRLDQRSGKSNWIEEITNTVSQLSLLIGILFLYS